ncbi:MAG: hypothetical protein J6V99_03250 [Neisseriaceae bacterium]|nr:hypothetical protein [Neisseriaceae bacterium]
MNIQQRKNGFILMSFLVLLTIVVSILAFWAFLTMTSGEKQTYHSPAEFNITPEAEILGKPSKAQSADSVPEETNVADAVENDAGLIESTENNAILTGSTKETNQSPVETISAETQIVAPVVENTDQIEAKPLDPVSTETQTFQSLDNLF